MKVKKVIVTHRTVRVAADDTMLVLFGFLEEKDERLRKCGGALLLRDG